MDAYHNDGISYKYGGAVTPDTDQNFNALQVTDATSGNLVEIMNDDSTTYVMFMTVGTVYPVRGKQVVAAGTTADTIIFLR